jgi:hypothetical protein
LIYFQLHVRKQGASRDGGGIDRVEISVAGPIDPFGDTDTVYTGTERNPGYCSFGGDDPCNLLNLSPGNHWPGGPEIFDGEYEAQLDVFLSENPGRQAGSWRFTFEIRRAGGELLAEIVQTGLGHNDANVSGALVFRVEAGIGSLDGSGIERVEMRILGPDGHEVHQRTERNFAYCIFAGGEPECNPWVFAEHGNAWPNNQPIQPGLHRLHAVVHAQDGRQKTVETTVQIRITP